jgi:hypothetical protein
MLHHTSLRAQFYPTGACARVGRRGGALVAATLGDLTVEREGKEQGGEERREILFSSMWPMDRRAVWQGYGGGGGAGGGGSSSSGGSKRQWWQWWQWWWSGSSCGSGSDGGGGGGGGKDDGGGDTDHGYGGGNSGGGGSGRYVGGCEVVGALTLVLRDEGSDPSLRRCNLGEVPRDLPLCLPVTTLQRRHLRSVGPDGRSSPVLWKTLFARRVTHGNWSAVERGVYEWVGG